MTGRYVPVEGRKVSRVIFGAIRQAIRVIRRDPETSQWTKELTFSGLNLGTLYHDEETSRHLAGDRYVYVVEGVNEGMPAFFTVDIVHEDRGDRRGHCVSVDLYTKGHHLEASVFLPLPGDEDGSVLPFVHVESISNVAT